MNRLFETIPTPNIKRTGFNLSHETKLTMEMGKLVVADCYPVVPGDTFKQSSEVMIRFAPMVAPLMHRVNVSVHYFYVPNRLVWSNFREFITGGESGEEEPALPFTASTAWNANVQAQGNNSPYFGLSSLWDYMGCPVAEDLPTQDDSNPNGSVHVSLLPFKAYQLIWNEYYRDQNLQEEVDILKDHDGYHDFSDVRELLTLRNRAWEKDYFSGALPWPQRGEDVLLPLHGGAPLIYNDTEQSILQGTLQAKSMAMTFNSQSNPDGSLLELTNGVMATSGVSHTTTGNLQFTRDAEDVGKLTNVVFGNASMQVTNPSSFASGFSTDLSQVTAATVNELRRATALQVYLERCARGGNRYIEFLLAHFGVKSSDARLQRPEYLGGGVMPLVVSEVLQTSSSDATSPQGTMAGHGIAVGKSHKFKAYFEEHGYVLGILSVTPKPSYQQGFPRDLLKMDKYDWYNPAFAHLGEQEIWNAELYGKTTNPFGLFGYTPRYAEYKSRLSTVHGDFKTNLNMWHLGRIFNNTPTLSEEFIQVDEVKDDLTRIFAAEQQIDPATGEVITNKPYQHLWVYIYHNIKAIRPMPKFGIPRL